MLGLLLLLQRLTLFISHVNTRSGFPAALSPQKEKELISLLEKGDEDAKNELIVHNLRLVAHIAKKYGTNTNADNDDLISIGTLGLIKAVSTYNAQKSPRLSSYACRCIENEILMHLRASKRKKAEMSLQEPVGTDKEGNEISLIDILGNDEEAIDSLDYTLHSARLYRELALLPPREKLIINLRYGLSGNERLTQKQVAQKLGISRSYVSRIEKSALAFLAERFRQGKGF